MLVKPLYSHNHIQENKYIYQWQIKDSKILKYKLMEKDNNVKIHQLEDLEEDRIILNIKQHQQYLHLCQVHKEIKKNQV